MTRPITLHDLQNLLHRAGWALSLAPQVVSAAEFTERDGWVTERGAAVHDGVNAYEILAEELVREINAALGLDLTMAPSMPDDDYETIQRLGRAAQRTPRRNPQRARPLTRKASTARGRSR